MFLRRKELLILKSRQENMKSMKIINTCLLVMGKMQKSKSNSRTGSKEEEFASRGGSKWSVERPFFMDTSPGGMAKLGAHLKRPSQEFETKKYESLEVTMKGLRKNLIRPIDVYPRFLVLLGAIIVHFTLGYIFSWGSIAPYLALYFEQDYLKTYYLDVASYSSLMFLGLALGFTCIERWVNSLGFRKVSLFLLRLHCCDFIFLLIYRSSRNVLMCPNLSNRIFPWRGL